MATAKLRSASGSEAGTVELDDAVFGIQPNVPVMHQVVTAQLAARRQGTQSTRTRAEVRGGGAKPWRQKGTGRARQGSIRSPQWVGGGVALGPKPRSYRQRTPKKMIRLALHSALSDRAASERLAVLDSWGIDTPSTKGAKAVLEALGTSGRVLVVLTRGDEAVWKSLRNLPEVHVLLDSELNAYDVLCADWVVFTRESLPTAKPVTRGNGKGERVTETEYETIVQPRKAAEPPGGAADDVEAGSAERGGPEEGPQTTQPPGGAADDVEAGSAERGGPEEGPQAAQSELADQESDA